MRKILAIAISIFTLSSCEIERLPYGSMDSGSIGDDPNASLEGLLNGTYAQLKAWSDPMHRLGEYAGDNMMIRGSSTDAFYEFISFSRSPNNGRLGQFWNSGYKAIAQASNLLNMVEEGQSEEIDQQLGEAYYVRGMMYFYMVRAFGKPYYQNPETNLGVPIVNGTPEDILDLQLPDRSTVQETYEQIVSDLKKAEELMTIDKSAIYATREAAQAMLSRVYLYMSGTYESPNQEYAQQAVEYADKVINSGRYSLLSRDQFMEYNTLTPENNRETIFAVKRIATEFSGSDHFYGIGGMYANIGGQGWGEMYASAKYIDLLDETGRNDWRPNSYTMVDARAAFIEPTYDASAGEVFRFIRQDGADVLNYVQAPITRSGGTITCTVGGEGENSRTYTLTPVDAAQEIYSIRYQDGNTYTGVIDNYISLNREYPQFFIVKCSREGEDSHLHSPVISRLGEVYLNRAEAQAKLGNYAQALEDLNLIRNRSIVNGGYASLDASNAGDLIDKERQLELAYQAERSFDVFRNGKGLERQYPGPHRQFETIQPADYRIIYFIPQSAINSYPGPLTQNPTS